MLRQLVKKESDQLRGIILRYSSTTATADDTRKGFFSKTLKFFEVKTSVQTVGFAIFIS